MAALRRRCQINAAGGGGLTRRRARSARGQRADEAQRRRTRAPQRYPAAMGSGNDNGSDRRDAGLRVFHTGEHPCGYWPERTARLRR